MSGFLSKMLAIYTRTVFNFILRTENIYCRVTSEDQGTKNILHNYFMHAKQVELDLSKIFVSLSQLCYRY